MSRRLLYTTLFIISVCALVIFVFSSSLPAKKVMETAQLTFAPAVPPPVDRTIPALVRVDLETIEKEGVLVKDEFGDTTYEFWTFNGQVPGPMIRVRVGDTIELHLKNDKGSENFHNIDLHAVTGPRGGAAALLVEPGEEKVARFKALNPGLYIYHCATPPVPEHIANGMYGMILVEPEGGLSPVDREFYVLQSEFYTIREFGAEGLQHFDEAKGAAEHPTYVVFNGSVGSLTGAGALKAKVGDRIRMYFGNAGPNLISSWHIIGEIFDRVYHEGSLTASPLESVQTTTVPAGGASVAEFTVEVPGNYILVDHSIFRIDKGVVGILNVSGKENPAIYNPIK